MNTPQSHTGPRLFPRCLRHLSAALLAGSLSLFVPTAAICADPGYVTAKTFVDPYHSIPPASGNGTTDDWQVLQDMITYALANSEAVKFEPGVYKISQTLVVQLPAFTAQHYGFRIAGIAGGNSAPGQPGGVLLELASTATGQSAVLGIGQGSLRDMIIENIGLVSQVGTAVTPYGLLFGETEFSHVTLNNVSVRNVDTAFAEVQGTTGGGNGEGVDLNECTASGVNCFYYNSVGEAYFHRITNASATFLNGGTALKIGGNNLGFGLDVSSFSGTFGTGPLRNTFLENLGVSGCINIKGGRIEKCDTLIDYSGGSNNQIGQVKVERMQFAVMSGNFPLLDATRHGTLVQSGEQYTDAIEGCVFTGSSGPTYPALSLASVSGDLSKNFFEKCTFTGFSNTLTSLSPTTLSQMGVVVRDTRAATGSSALLSNISYHSAFP